VFSAAGLPDVLSLSWRLKYSPMSQYWIRVGPVAFGFLTRMVMATVARLPASKHLAAFTS